MKLLLKNVTRSSTSSLYVLLVTRVFSSQLQHLTGHLLQNLYPHSEETISNVTRGHISPLILISHWGCLKLPPNALISFCTVWVRQFPLTLICHGGLSVTACFFIVHYFVWQLREVTLVLVRGHFGTWFSFSSASQRLSVTVLVLDSSSFVCLYFDSCRRIFGCMGLFISPWSLFTVIRLFFFFYFLFQVCWFISIVCVQFFFLSSQLFLLLSVTVLVWRLFFCLSVFWSVSIMWA